ncbi:MAG: helix-turn-helix domain-containing protein [Actinomycetales bacterium]|nr:helix-turn-helix domain-containing protein [Actinomycetales bacterium]
MPDSRDVQAAVDALAAELSCPVLVEDPAHQPLWWSGSDPGDEVRLRSILQRTVAPEAAAMVRRLRLDRATAAVRTPEVPEVAMRERWCVPLRAGGEHVGYLWVVDPEGRVGADRLPVLEECADLASTVLGATRTGSADRERRRAGLVDRLLHGPDEDAARELAELERLPYDVRVVVRESHGGSGWLLPHRMSGQAWSARSAPAPSGPALPLAELSEALRRALCVRRALAAGALLAAPVWDALGAWRLVVDAPAGLAAADVHPGAAVLAARRRPDLLETARAMLDHGGDVNAASALLHVHRTTLYYRLDRIRDLIGVDLREGHGRTELHLALWLDAYARTTPDD